MAKKSSSPIESSSPKQQKSKAKKPSPSNGNADIRSFFAPAAPKKELSFSDDEDDKSIIINDSNNKSKSLDSKKDNSSNSSSSSGKLSKLKKLKKEESSDDDDFSLSEEESNKENKNNSHNNKSASTSDKSGKFKSVMVEEKSKSPKKSTASKSPVSKDIDLSSQEANSSGDEKENKSTPNKKKSSNTSGKVTSTPSLKRKEKPDSSSEDEKQEEKKRKVKTPEKTSSSTPTKSPSKAKTPEKKVRAQLDFEPMDTAPATKNTPTKPKTPENKTRVVDDIVKVDELYLGLKPRDDDIFAENQVSAIPKRQSNSVNTPEKSNSPSKDENKSKSSNKQEKFNENDIFDSPIKTPTKSTTSTPVKKNTTSNLKNEKKFNEDDIFDSPPPAASKSSTPIKKNSSTIVKKEKKFNEDDIFNSPPESKSTLKSTSAATKPIQRSSSKFNEDDIFDDDETDSDSEMKIDNKKPTLASKLKKVKQEEYNDEDDEETESESEENDKKFKSKITSASSTTKLTPAKPSTKPAASNKQQNYLKFKLGIDTRGPPPNLGKKPLPVGKPNCLAGKTFFFTGILDSLERESAQDLVKRYGGHVAKSVVKKLTHLIVGTDPGEAKLEKAKKMGSVKFMDEDQLFEMISSTLPKPPPQQQPKEEKEQEQQSNSQPLSQNEEQQSNSQQSSQTMSSSPPNPTNKSISSIKPTLPSKPSIKPPTLPSKPIAKLTSSTTTTTTTTPKSNTTFKSASSLPQYEYTPPPQNISMSSISVPDNIKSIPKGHDQLWVEKYKPKVYKDLIGNNTIFDQLSKFLQQFNSNRDNANKRNAVLLSGPPGIGKTSAAILLCKNLGYEPIELNASDTRSKSEIERVLKGVSECKNISHFFSANSQEKEKKNAIILDEIDGSSGNSDRGGISEIIQLIKKSKVPFICICNDYYSTKIKSLKNYCMDLRLKRPTSNQVTTRLLQICKHEGMKISNYMIEKIFASTHSDIRQTINSLQMLSRSKKSYDDFTIDKAIESKDFDITPFNAVEQLFKTSNGEISTQLEYFFSDFSLVPLLIQENYLSVNPYGANKDDPPIECYSNAADAICDSDEIGRAVSKEMAWQLLPSYGVASTILPAGYVRGYPTVMPLRFPSYLGKYSNASKQQRFVKDLQLHMRSTSVNFSNRNETRLYYVPMLKHYLIEPLVQDSQDGIDTVIQMMDDYGLTEEDRNNIIELSTWGKDTNLLANVTTQIKTAFTKKFRAGTHAVYDHSLLTVTKGNGDLNIAEGYEEAEGEETTKLVEDDEEDNQEDEDITKSSLIKKSTTKSTNKSTSTKSTSTKSTSTKSKSKK